MRRLLTLVCLLGLAIPAGISFSGCTRNPAGAYCNGAGYGLKITAVASIILQPQVAGISLAYGQTIQAQAPTAYTCKETTASVGSSQYSYGTKNNQLVDISPTGNICAGTWNRNTGGGIANYTYCYYPNPLPQTCNPPGSTSNCLPYGITYIYATADSVTSNPVEVYVHPPVTSLSLVTTPLSGGTAQACYSQTQQAQLDVNAYYDVNNTQTLLCTPGSTTLPDCSNSIGTLSFSVGTSSVASIEAATLAHSLPTITAEQPGTTVITATIAQSSSTAGYFSTCPPKSISVALADGATKGVVTQGVVQNLTTTVTDTQGNPINGLALTYQSTQPIDVTAGSGGSISASFPGSASVNALCEPSACNPAPINEIGVYGTGLPISSNPVNIIVPGTASDFAWFGAPNQSQYFSSVELLTGAPGSLVRLPYVPNSMVMDQLGHNLYFGSLHELMVYSTSTNTISTQSTSIPGVVLAVAPNASQLLVNDQVRDVFYLYGISSNAATTFPGLGAAAAWTPDSNTLYIVDSKALGGNHTDTLYVHNNNTGWSTYDLSASGGSQSLAITVPGIGAYLAGDPTVGHTWCPSGTVGNNATMQFYPQSDSVNLLTSVLGATTDGDHILGASLSGTSITLDDIGVKVPATVCTGVGPSVPALGGTLSPLPTGPTINGSVTLTGPAGGPPIDAAAINQVVTAAAPTTASVNTAAPIAFVTYNPPPGSSSPATLPYYLPQASGLGPVGYVSFADSSSATPPTAPLAGAFSPDHTLFFVSTSGDNEIHFIGIPDNLSISSPPAEEPSSQMPPYSPNLPACTPVSAGGDDLGCLYPTAPATNAVVPATSIAVKPRSVT